MSELFDAKFEDHTQWATLLVTFVFVVTQWFSIRTFGDSGFLSQSRYESTQRAFADRGFGAVVLRSSWALIALQTIRNLFLWIAWTYYLIERPLQIDGENDTHPDADTEYYEDMYLATNIAILVGTIFHQFAEAAFYQVAWFGLSFAARIIEAIAFIVSLILVIIQLVEQPTESACDVEVVMIIILSIIVAHNLFVLLPRNWAFWQYDTGSNSAGSAELLPSGAPANANQQSPYLSSGVHQRASSSFSNKKY